MAALCRCLYELWTTIVGKGPQAVQMTCAGGVAGLSTLLPSIRSVDLQTAATSRPEDKVKNVGASLDLTVHAKFHKTLFTHLLPLHPLSIPSPHLKVDILRSASGLDSDNNGVLTATLRQRLALLLLLPFDSRVHSRRLRDLTRLPSRLGHSSTIQVSRAEREGQGSEVQITMCIPSNQTQIRKYEDWVKLESSHPNQRQARCLA